MGVLLWCWRSLIIEVHCPPQRPFFQARKHLSFDASSLQGELLFRGLLLTNSGRQEIDDSYADLFLPQNPNAVGSCSSWAAFLRNFFALLPSQKRSLASGGSSFASVEWSGIRISEFHLCRSFALTRFLTMLDGRRVGLVENPSSQCGTGSALPLLARFRWIKLRSFAADAVTEPEQRDSVLRILNGAGQLDYGQMDSAFQSLDIDWGSKLLVRKAVQHIEDPKTAFKFFAWVVDRKGFRPTSVEYNALLEVLGSAEMFHLMRLVVTRMDEAKCKLLPSTFTILIKYYGKAGLVDEATELLAKMKKNGVEPNVQTYNNLMMAFLKKGSLDLSLGIYEQMRCNGISPNEYTVNFLTDGLCRAGQLEEAKKFVREATSSNIFVYNVLLKGFCKAGKVEEGYELLDEMTSRGFSPDEYTYNTLIVGSCKAEKLDFALKLRVEMLQKNIAPTLITYGTLIMFLCKSKREEDAFQLLANMMAEGFVLTEKDYNSLWVAFSKTKRKVSGAELLKKMREEP